MFSDVFAQIESKFISSHSRAGIHDPSARVAALSIVNNGIGATRQFLRSLLTRRNALMPISLLPPEILARVFHLLVAEEPPFLRRQNPGWIKVTHVCRHWRQVALDDSSLWARIWAIRTNTKWILEMLARAKNAPLDIELNAVRNPSPESLLMISPHISHTRQFRIHSLSTLHFDSVQEIFSREAPALEHFELTATARSPIDFRELGGNMLFKGHAPRLRTLSLSPVVIPWSLIPRGQLTQLKIACHNEDHDSPSNLNQLTDLLVNCPALEILALEFCLPSQLAEFPPDQTIQFPHLSHLRLCGSTSRIMNMLKMLKLPSSTTLHLSCISETASTHNDLEDLLLPVISAQFQTPVPIEFKSLSVIIPQYIDVGPATSSLKITASTSHSTLRKRSDGISELVLSFNRLSKPNHATDLLKQACAMLPISNLEFISMTAPGINDINWVELFGCCTNVITMDAIGHGTSGLVQALTNPGSGKKRRKVTKRKRDNRASTLVQPASTMAHAQAAIFPKLNSLGLANLNFAEGEHSSGTLFDVLERGLKQRMAAWAPLKLLMISDCEISAEYANDLKKLVLDFDWDDNDGLIEIGDSDESLYDPDEVYSANHRATLQRLFNLDPDGFDYLD